MIYVCYNYDIEKVNKMDYRKLIKELREKLILSPCGNGLLFLEEKYKCSFGKTDGNHFKSIEEN